MKNFNFFVNSLKEQQGKVKHLTCSYCAVGCEFKIIDNKIILNKDENSVNNGSLCIKGYSLLETKNKGRLLKNLYRKTKNTDFEEINYEESIKLIADKLKNTKPDKIAFYSAGQVTTEDYYLGNKLFKGFIGTNNVDSNSRTCIASALVALKQSLGDDYIPVTMKEVLDTDLIIVSGANPANSHVIFFDKYIKKAKKTGKKMVVIDPIYTQTAKYANLYIKINPGTDLIFNNCTISYILQKNKIKDLGKIKNRVNNWEEFYLFYSKYNWKTQLFKTGVNIELFKKFINEYLLKYENIISITAMGYNQSSEGVYNNISLLNIHILLDKIGKYANGYFPETGQANAMGGREVSGLSTLLAVHLDFSEKNREKVAKFWGTELNKIPKKSGNTILEIMNESNKGNIDVLIIMHTDPIYSLPNRNKMEQIMKKIPFVVEINAYENTETSKFVNLRVPAAPWGEKDGKYTNLDRKISFLEKINKTKNIKTDSEILIDIAKELGYTKFFNYKNSDEIFDEFTNMTKLNKNFGTYHNINSYIVKNNNIIRWENLKFKNEHKFFTPNGKPNLIITNDNTYKILVDEKYPLTLISYRVKGHWNSGSKTLLSNKITKKYGKEGYILISINTLENIFHDIPEEGTLLTIQSKTGKIKLPIKYSNKIHEDCIAIPTFERKINYLTDDSLFDPFSKQPAYNICPIKISLN